MRASQIQRDSPEHFGSPTFHNGTREHLLFTGNFWLS